VFLETQVGVLLEPPRGDLSFTNPAEHGQRWRVVLGILDPGLGELGQITGKDLCSRAQRVDDDVGKVNLDFSWCNPRSDHPHGLSSR
jgi:hypothetical protein